MYEIGTKKVYINRVQKKKTDVLPKRGRKLQFYRHYDVITQDDNIFDLKNTLNAFLEEYFPMSGSHEYIKKI